MVCRHAPHPDDTPCGGELCAAWARHFAAVTAVKDRPRAPWAAGAPPPQPPLPPVLPEPARAWRDRIRTCLYRDPPGKGCGCQSARCWAGRGLSGLVGDRDCYECLTQTGRPP